MNTVLAFIMALSLQGHLEDSGKTLGIIGCGMSGSTIIRVWPGSPAEQAGLHEGDKIVESMDEAGNKCDIDGEPYTKVILGVEYKVCMVCSKDWRDCIVCNERGRNDYCPKCGKGNSIRTFKRVTLTRVPYQSLNNKTLNQYFGDR